jgi:pimeloyl-ACP methyl ester carboxylesterase
LRHFYPDRWNGQGNDFSIRQHAADLASFIKQLNSGPVHLVAHSRGGDVALTMAKTHPTLIRSMVLVDPAPYDSLLPSSPASDAIAARRKDQVTRTLEQYQRGDIDRGLEIFIDLAVAPGTYKNAPAPLKQTWRDNAWSIKNLLTDAQEPFSCADAGTIDLPVLLVTGEKSPPIYGLMLNGLQSCLPRQEKATIPNASHGMARTHSGPFNSTVLPFLAGH